MDNDSTDEVIENSADAATDAPTQLATIADEMLIEEISIDGMCGVY